MYCKHCGKEINGNSQFCKYCGNKISNNNQIAPDKPDEINTDNNKITFASVGKRRVVVKAKNTENKIIHRAGTNETPDENLKSLYYNLKYNKEELSSQDINLLISDFKNRATTIVAENCSGKYEITVNDDNNGILVYCPDTHFIEFFVPDLRNGFKKTFEIDNNTCIYTIGTDIVKLKSDVNTTATNNTDKNNPAKSEGYHIEKEMVKTAESSAGSFYIVDFFKNIIRKNNTGVIIWLIINTVLVTFLIGYILTMSSFEMQMHPVLAYFIGFVVYLMSVVIAVSPIGEFILRLQTGCREIKRQDYLDRLNPLFEEVYKKAKEKNPNLPDDIKFFMSKDKEPNAFATGRKTICMTEGLLDYSDEEIKGILGHEFGHLAHKDTDAILVVEVGNLIVTGIFVAFRLLVKIITLIFHLLFSIVSSSFAEIFVSAITRVLIDFLLVAVMTIWTKLGTLICLHSSRKNEFEADEYCCSLGYGEKLCAALDKMDNIKGGKSTLWATLNSTHPDTDERIAKMQALGVVYSK